LLSALGLALGAVSLSALAQTWHSPWTRLTALLFYPAFPLLLTTLSSETPLYLACCLGAFAFYARQRYHLTALCAALAILFRADGALVALILGGHYWVWQRQRPMPWSAILLGLLIVLPWLMFAQTYFGSPVSATLAAKQHQGSLAISQRFAPRLLEMARAYWHWPYSFEAGLAAAGLAFAVGWARRWGPLLSWTALYFLAYTALGVSGYFWYYAPLVPGFFAAVGLGLEGLTALLRRGRPRWGRAGLALGMTVLVILGAAQVRDALRLRHSKDNRLQIYRAIGDWLEANTPPEARIGALEVGLIGYFARRPMVDFAGLIQPAVANQLTPTTTYENAAAWAILEYRPDYVVLNPAWFPTLMQEAVFRACSVEQTFAGETYGYPGELMIYRCQWAGQGS
jgi:hypothetical protein